MAESLKYLRDQWGDAYEIRRAGQRFIARRRDGGGTVSATTTDGLLTEIRNDYNAAPVPRGALELR